MMKALVMSSIRLAKVTSKVMAEVNNCFIVHLTGAAVGNSLRPTAAVIGFYKKLSGKGVEVTQVILVWMKIQCCDLCRIFFKNVDIVMNRCWSSYSVASELICTPRGRERLAQRYLNLPETLTKLFFQISRDRMSELNLTKGDQLVKAGRVEKRTAASGATEYACKADPENCDQVSNSLQGSAIHVGRSHAIRSKPEKRKGEGQIPAGKLIKQMQQQDVVDPDLEHDISVMLENEDTDTTFHDLEESAIGLPTFSQIFSQQSGDSLPEGMETPDKSHLREPSDEIMREFLEQTDFFEEEDEEPNQKNVPHVIKDESVVAETQHVLCSICGMDDPIYEAAGIHMMDVHHEELDYCPKLWKLGAPTYLTATMSKETPIKTLLSCIEECRERIYRDTTYFNQREDSVSCYKESLSKLQSRLDVVKEQLKVAEEYKSDEMGSREVLLNRVEELEEEIANLNANKESHEVEKKQAADKLREMRKQLANAKSKASIFSSSNETTNNLSKNLSAQLEETKKIQAIADQKVSLGASKIKKLQQELNDAIKAKLNAEKMLEESQEIVKGFIEVNSTKTVQPVAEPAQEDMETDAFDATANDDKVVPAPTAKVNAVIDGKKNNGKKDMKKSDRRCKFLSWNTGCKRGDSCLFYHPTVECESYISGNCKDSNKNCNLLHNLKKKKAFEKNNSKVIKSASTIKQNTPNSKKTTKPPTGNCAAWLQGRCPHHIMGKDFCEEGKHVMGMWGKGREEEVVDKRVEQLINAGRAQLAASTSAASPALRQVNKTGSRASAQPNPRANLGGKQK